MRLQARIEKLETTKAKTVRQHVLLVTPDLSPLQAIEAYGRDRIGEGEDVVFLELICLTKEDAKSTNAPNRI